MKKNQKVMPTTYFIILLLATVGINLLYPPVKTLYSPLMTVGLLLIVLGIVLNLWTDNFFKKAQTTVKPFDAPKVLLTSGPFRISRNPMYLGMALMLFGVSAFFGSIITLAFPIFFIVLIEVMFVRFEEKNLQRIFSSEYDEYKNKIRKWI